MPYAIGIWTSRKSTGRPRTRVTYQGNIWWWPLTGKVGMRNWSVLSSFIHNTTVLDLNQYIYILCRWYVCDTVAAKLAQKLCPNDIRDRFISGLTTNYRLALHTQRYSETTDVDARNGKKTTGWSHVLLLHSAKLSAAISWKAQGRSTPKRLACKGQVTTWG